MTTVKLFKITPNGSLTIAEHFNTQRMDYDETEAFCDDGAEYILPEGYRVSDNVMGEPMIYDPTGEYCTIALHSSGRPQLFSARRAAPVLSLAEEG